MSVGSPSLFTVRCPDCDASGYERGHAGCRVRQVLAGRADPATSHEAAETIRLILGELQILTLWTIRRIGTPATTHDLGRFAAAEDPLQRGEEWWRQRYGRRISELSRATPTLITAQSSERDPVTRMRCMRWSLTAAGRQMSTPERVHPILRGCPMSECSGCDVCLQARAMVSA